MSPGRPAVAPAAEWHFPLPRVYRLGNGMAVWHYQLPGRRLASARLVFDLPLSAEDPAQEGVTALLARTMDEGTEVRSAEEFADETERHGASYHADANYSGFQTGISAPVGRLEPALALVAEAAARPAFPADEVGRAVRNRLDDIVDERARPTRRARVELAEMIFHGSCRLSRPDSGIAETVETVDREAVHRWYDRQVAPDRATLVLAGDFSRIDVPALLDRSFGTWRAEAAPAVPPIEPVGNSGGRVRVVHRPGAVQTHLEFGVPGPDRHDPAWAAARVANHALGGTITSRLDAVLREEKGYTYGTRSALRPYRRGSVFAITGSVHTAVTGESVALALRLAEALRTEGITEAERDRAVDYLLGVTPLQFQTAQAVADRAADLASGDLEPGHVAVQRAALAQVTAQSATEALAPCLEPDRLCLVAVGDAEVIVKQLRAHYGEVDVVPL